MYGTVEKEEELTIKFLTCYQDENESAADYLQRLYLIVTDIDESEPSEDDLIDDLRKQFVRGARDDQLIHRLKLEVKQEGLTYAKLFQMIREEEHRVTERRKRFIPSKSRAQVASIEGVSLAIPSDPGMDTLRSEVAELKAIIQSQATATSGRSTSEKSGKKGHVRQTQAKGGKFCYNCGEDGHVQGKCSNAKNAELVQEKLITRYKQNCKKPSGN